MQKGQEKQVLQRPLPAPCRHPKPALRPLSPPPPTSPARPQACLQSGWLKPSKLQRRAKQGSLSSLGPSRIRANLCAAPSRHRA